MKTINEVKKYVKIILNLTILIFVIAIAYVIVLLISDINNFITSTYFIIALLLGLSFIGIIIAKLVFGILLVLNAKVIKEESNLLLATGIISCLSATLVCLIFAIIAWNKIKNISDTTSSNFNNQNNNTSNDINSDNNKINNNN